MKVLVIKINEATDAIDKMTITKEPRKILIHTATNHFSSKENDDANNANLTQVKNELEDLSGKIQRKCPNSSVYISELFICEKGYGEICRRDVRLHKDS